MAIIKRYPNRKLYDTEAKQYITLDGIAALIRQGDEVQVVDHTTGEDLTTLTLTQIILEQEKKKSGFLPRAVLTGLVQAGGERLGALRTALAAPLDLLRQVDEEIEARVHTLIKGGEIGEDEGLRLLDKLLAQARRSSDRVRQQTGKAVSGQVEQLLQQQGVPTQEDVARLAAQLDSLAAKLEQLSLQAQQHAPRQRMAGQAEPGADASEQAL